MFITRIENHICCPAKAVTVKHLEFSMAFWMLVIRSHKYMIFINHSCTLSYAHKHYEDAFVRTLLVWMVQDSLHSLFLDGLTFGMTFWRQFAAAIALCLSSHYFPSLFFVTFAAWQKRAGFNRGVRGREGKDAGQIGSTVVFSRCPQENSPPWSHLNSEPGSCLSNADPQCWLLSWFAIRKTSSSSSNRLDSGNRPTTKQ